jgi:hypothetical protein
MVKCNCGRELKHLKGKYKFAVQINAQEINKYEGSPQEEMKIQDMEKIECPFIRKLNDKNEYLITPELNPGFEWVFEDDKVMAIEKLHGTNVSILIQDGIITSIWNRTERIPFFNKGKSFIIEGLIESYKNGYMEFLPDGQHFGELIGEKVNGNPYKIEGHLWVPFSTFCQKHLRYKSWGKYPKDFETISEWFKDLMPLYWLMQHGMEKDKEGKNTGFVEGIVFTHPDGRMAKVRKDMFEWFSGRRHGE